MTADDFAALAYDLIARAPYSFLISYDAGVAMPRLMQHYPPDARGRLWFGADPASRKFAQIAADPRVVVTVELPADRAFAVFWGQAARVDEPAQLRRYWRSEWAEFFPDGPDQGYALVCVTPHIIELISFAAGIGDARPPRISRHNDEWRLVE